MYPEAFHYHRPHSLNDAISLISKLGGGAKFLAGGQTLIPLLKMRMLESGNLVDIARIPGMSYIKNDNGYVNIGALATHERIAKSEVATLVPIIGDCAAGIADHQVRNLGTIGGSVSVADPSSDWPMVLHTLDAEVICQGPAGKRTVAIRDFIIDPYTTILGTAELVVEIRFKLPPAKSGGAYIGFKKAAPSYQTASAGIQLTLADDNRCEEIRLVLGSAGPKAITSVEAESLLRGNLLNRENLQHAAEIIVAVSDPTADTRGSVEFKRATLKSLFVQSAERAILRAYGKQISSSHEYA